ncbi:MAG: hypothetical protein II562_03190 [Prevotella sp.]|nr:hypothetical protein [Prevotella sp.]
MKEIEEREVSFPPAHTAEHLLNQLMMRLFGCERACEAHVERKKSKLTYVLETKPDRKVEREIEREMNSLIEQDMEVSHEVMTRSELEDLVYSADAESAESRIDISRLPASAGDTVRLVRIGDYDVCPCVGKHVRSTGQIGRFELLGTNWDEHAHTYRIRYKVIQ